MTRYSKAGRVEVLIESMRDMVLIKSDNDSRVCNYSHAADQLDPPLLELICKLKPLLMAVIGERSLKNF